MSAAAVGSSHSANTPPRLAGHDVFATDAPLAEALAREGAAWAEDDLRALGTAAGRPEVIDWGFAANDTPPVHVPYDRSGVRTDDVRFHPAWHQVMALAVEHGLHGAPWADPRPGSHVARAAKYIVLAQVEAGSVTCPIAMTYACVPALRLVPELAEAWEPLVTSSAYDPRLVPRADKTGALIGMAMTERQGGSDVRSSTTVARPEGDGTYLVSGQKWFVSAVQSDAFFVVAQAPGGLTCLFVPRLCEDGSPNGFRLDRLKDKLGNRSNPTAEVDLREARAVLVGEEGHGVRAMMTMIAGTRQDCVLASTALMRLGTSEAIHYADHRQAFGQALSRQPAMAGVLADLSVESEAATIAALRLARAHEEAARGDEAAEQLRRLAAPVLKYWICKRAPAHAAEAVECQGGFGYVEESRLPRMYREAPLASIWEGTGNVQALDVLRAAARSPESVEALLGEIGAAHGADRRLDAALDALRRELRDGDALEARARRLTGLMARCLQGALLVQHGDPAVADAFCASRLEGGWEGAFGTLGTGVDCRAIVDRHRPG